MKPVRKAVFPVAGLGTRFLPATKASPKEMLAVVDKPLIQYAVEEAVAAHSLVGKDMPEDSLVSGSPAKRLCKASDMRLKNDVRVRAYPWRNRFVRGYPDSIVEKWANGIDSFDF